jgi:prohibitin 1
MEYVIAREKQEATRRLIDAEGVRRANEELAKGLTPEVLRYKAMEALASLAASPNAKVIITPNSDPFSLGNLQGQEAAAPARK